MSRAVYRTTISIEVMLCAGSAEEAAATLSGMSLEDILHDADSEGMIAGSPVRTEPEIVPADMLRDELVAIGNDGTFFDFELEDTDHDDADS